MKIIVCYSYSGNSLMIANKIKEKLNIDVIQIIPKESYTTDYDKLVEDAKEYSKCNVMPIINSIDISKYNEIILVCPVWWYTYASPVNTFLNNNNFDGKIIYPVITNGGWIGHTLKDIEDKVNIKYPLNLVFNNNALTNEDDLEIWFNNFK